MTTPALPDAQGHFGPFGGRFVPETLMHPLQELEDWTVELRDGTIRGGFGYRVVFQRTRERLGRLPDDLARHESRYVDHRPAEVPLGRSGA